MAGARQHLLEAKHQRAVAAHAVPHDGGTPGIQLGQAAHQLAQLLADVGLHAVAAGAPGVPRRVHIEARPCGGV